MIEAPEIKDNVVAGNFSDKGILLKEANPVVTVCGLENLGEIIQAWKPDVVISTVPIYIEGTPPFEREQLLTNDIMLAQMAGYKAAIRAVIKHDSGRVLIHCEQGKSRSAALAIALIWSRAIEPVEAVQRWLAENPGVQPNPLILLLADEILGADFALLRACRDRYKGRDL